MKNYSLYQEPGRFQTEWKKTGKRFQLLFEQSNKNTASMINMLQWAITNMPEINEKKKKILSKEKENFAKQNTHKRNENIKIKNRKK